MSWQQKLPTRQTNSKPGNKYENKVANSWLQKFPAGQTNSNSCRQVEKD